jgi:hypothetical protein
MTFAILIITTVFGLPDGGAAPAPTTAAVSAEEARVFEALAHLERTKAFLRHQQKERLSELLDGEMGRPVQIVAGFYIIPEVAAGGLSAVIQSDEVLLRLMRAEARIDAEQAFIASLLAPRDLGMPTGLKPSWRSRLGEFMSEAPDRLNLAESKRAGPMPRNERRTSPEGRREP